MSLLTIGKYRGLQRISSGRNTLTCLALDHRQNLRRILDPDDPEGVDDLQLSNFKLEVCAALADASTAVILDPQYSAAQAVALTAIPGRVGLIVTLESTGFGGQSTQRLSSMLPRWSVEKAKRMGADAVKLLVYYHPDSQTAREIEAFVLQAAEECRRYDLCLILEPLLYPLEVNRPLPAAERKRVVVESARRLTPCGVDVLKAEFPGDWATTDEPAWEAACAEISSVSTVPWILLSAAADYETYLLQVRSACRAGASGIAVGRTVWQEAVEMEAPARAEFLKSEAHKRLTQLDALCREQARPWTDAYSAEAPLDWYQIY